VSENDGSWLRDRAAIVGIGHTKFGQSGAFADIGAEPLVVESILKACDDAGISAAEIDGFSSNAAPLEPGDLAAAFGGSGLQYTAQTWGGGGGAMAGAYMNAAMAVATGQAKYVTIYKGIVGRRGDAPPTEFPASSRPVPYTLPHGLVSPGHVFALAAQRHMHCYGTTIDHFAEVAINARLMAAANPRARFRDPITIEDHHNSPMIADPFRLFDFCMQSDVGAAVVITSAERARDLRQAPVYLSGIAMGAVPRWGQGMFGGYNMADEDFASAGQRTVAETLYRRAGLGPNDIDVAQLYDHFTGMLLMELEDFGLCKKGESGPFVADGNIRLGGSLPVNTHGGNLAEVFGHGITHVIEGVRQIRGTSVNQVPDAEVCLVVAGSSPAPTSAMVLHK
jgi:acetyl-CoA acetyltransferase